jgi:hypothetical protein
MHVQRLVSVVKMATVLERYTTEVQHSVVRFLWAKGLCNKEMISVYGGKCDFHLFGSLKEHRFFLVGWDLRHQVLRPLLAYCTAPDDR